MQFYHSRFQFKPPSDKYFKMFFLLWIVPFLIMLILVVFKFFSLPPQVPLFYSRIWGENQLANKEFLFLPIAGVFLLGIFNNALGMMFYPKDKVMSYLLAGAASLVSILSTITIINILLLFI